MTTHSNTQMVFQIVARERDYKPFEKRPGRDQWGWGVVGQESAESYEAAKARMEQYAREMPSHVVRLRVVKLRG